MPEFPRGQGEGGTGSVPSRSLSPRQVGTEWHHQPSDAGTTRAWRHPSGSAATPRGPGSRGAAWPRLARRGTRLSTVGLGGLSLSALWGPHCARRHGRGRHARGVCGPLRVLLLGRGRAHPTRDGAPGEASPASFLLPQGSLPLLLSRQLCPPLRPPAFPQRFGPQKDRGGCRMGGSSSPPPPPPHRGNLATAAGPRAVARWGHWQGPPHRPSSRPAGNL